MRCTKEKLERCQLLYNSDVLKEKRRLQKHLFSMRPIGKNLKTF